MTCCCRWSRASAQSGPTRCSRCPCRPWAAPGFLQDYPIEQYVRDAKIDSLYEGTTAIQGLDLYWRKIVRNGGRALTALLSQIKDFAASEAGNGQLKSEPRAAEAM